MAHYLQISNNQCAKDQRMWPWKLAYHEIAKLPPICLLVIGLISRFGFLKTHSKIVVLIASVDLITYKVYCQLPISFPV